MGLLFLLLCVSSTLRDVSPQTIEYAIDTSVQGAERELLAEATKQATAMWSDQNPGLEFVWTDKQNVLQIRTNVPWFAGLVTYGFANGFAKCPIWDTDTTDCVVYVHQDLLDTDLGKYRSLEVQLVNTLAHELGHVLGLSHYPDTMSNHLMGTTKINPARTSTDTKGYIVPAPIPLP